MTHGIMPDDSDRQPHMQPTACAESHWKRSASRRGDDMRDAGQASPSDDLRGVEDKVCSEPVDALASSVGIEENGMGADDRLSARSCWSFANSDETDEDGELGEHNRQIAKIITCLGETDSGR